MSVDRLFRTACNRSVFQVFTDNACYDTVDIYIIFCICCRCVSDDIFHAVNIYFYCTSVCRCFVQSQCNCTSVCIQFCFFHTVTFNCKHICFRFLNRLVKFNIDFLTVSFYRKNLCRSCVFLAEL